MRLRFRLHCAGALFVGLDELDALRSLPLSHQSITILVLSATETALMSRDSGILVFLTAQRELGSFVFLTAQVWFGLHHANSVDRTRAQ